MEKFFTRDVAKMFFKRVNFAQLGAVILFLIGLILMAAEVDSESMATFATVKVAGLALFIISVFLLRRIDPKSWVNPWERRG